MLTKDQADELRRLQESAIRAALDRSRAIRTGTASDVDAATEADFAARKAFLARLDELTE